MHVSHLPLEHQQALAQLQAAEDKVRALGFVLLRQAALYMDDNNAHFSTRISIPYDKENVMFDHAFADGIRDLSVEWHNARHESSGLVWRKKKYKKETNCE